MLAAEAAVRGQLEEVVRLLNGARYQLLGLLASLPPEPPDDAPEDPEAAEPPIGAAAELRSAIECALHDHLQPAIQALAAAARLELVEPE